MLYLQEEMTFVKQINEYKQQAEKNMKVILTRFLTLREQAIVESIFKNSFVDLHFYGGFEAAERKRCLIVDPSIPVYKEMFEITCFRIDYNKRFLDITHSNILGTLMSMQLDRSLFGDIVFYEGEVYFYSTSDIQPIINMEFKTINRTPITTEVIDEPIEPRIEYETIEVIASSYRIDVLISQVYNLSRSDAERLISEQKVYRNFQLCVSKSTNCEKGDIISVRRHGRFIVGETVRKTRSNKFVVMISKP